jgi:threonine synthase
VREHGGLCRNTGYNPLTIEGKKTVALEIVSQLGGVPDHVFVPTGDGVILGGVYKGFEDLVALGYAERVPVIHAVQAQGSSAICRALREEKFTRVRAATLADSISVEVPANGPGAVARLQKYNGRCIEVTDEAILEAQHRLARTSGLFAEPAAAAAFAGLLAANLPADAVTVVLVTGSGLKDIDAASRVITLPAPPEGADTSGPGDGNKLRKGR